MHTVWQEGQQQIVCSEGGKHHVADDERSFLASFAEENSCVAFWLDPHNNRGPLATGGAVDNRKGENGSCDGDASDNTDVNLHVSLGVEKRSELLANEECCSGGGVSSAAGSVIGEVRILFSVF